MFFYDFISLSNRWQEYKRYHDPPKSRRDMEIEKRNKY